ncbi:protein of unknown function [Agreia sp. COWG]|nr:protein of unknown function [Agreia sp. COWG]
MGIAIGHDNSIPERDALGSLWRAGP